MGVKKNEIHHELQINQSSGAFNFSGSIKGGGMWRNFLLYYTEGKQKSSLERIIKKEIFQNEIAPDFFLLNSTWSEEGLFSALLCSSPDYSQEDKINSHGERGLFTCTRSNWFARQSEREKVRREDEGSLTNEEAYAKRETTSPGAAKEMLVAYAINGKWWRLRGRKWYLDGRSEDVTHARSSHILSLKKQS